MENLHKVFDSAVYYIANTEMSLTELWAYVSQAKSNMESTAVAAVTMTNRPRQLRHRPDRYAQRHTQSHAGQKLTCRLCDR